MKEFAGLTTSHCEVQATLLRPLSFLFMVSLIFLAASCLLVDADYYLWCGIRYGERTLSNAIVTTNYGIGIFTLILYVEK